TLVGAVPGALPVLGVWAAARGALGAEAWVLFGMMYLWQLPHVLALSWIHREDYAAAGLRQLSGTDAGGRITFAYATLAATTLLALALAPRALGMAGNAYAAGAAASPACCSGPPSRPPGSRARCGRVGCSPSPWATGPR